MNKFIFKIDHKGEKFCNEIIKTMVTLFKINSSEALSKMNTYWRDLNGVCLDIDDDKDELVYYYSPDFWAKTIYYGYPPNLDSWMGSPLTRSSRSPHPPTLEDWIFYKSDC